MTEPSPLADYLCDHLFVLVGTNPLPNYVAARLLLRPGGALYLVHTDFTKEKATKLATQCKLPAGSVTCVPVSEIDVADIRQRITAQAERLGAGQVGLDYTGGKKIVAVYACQALREATARREPPPVFTYLDSASNKFIVERPQAEPFCSESVLFALKPPPKLEDLVNLHASLKERIERQPVRLDLAAALLEAHLKRGAGEDKQGDAKKKNEKTAGREWNRWCSERLAETPKGGEVELPFHPDLQDFLAEFKKATGTKGATLNLRQAAERGEFTDQGALRNWLQSKWLEYYVLAQVQDLKESGAAGIHDCGMSIKPVLPSGGPEFEVDVGVMQGYQILAISCTTDPRPEMGKLKLLEAYERARNMGGDEAFAALVSPTEKTSTLEKAISKTWRNWAGAGKSKVFGREALANGGLRAHLKAWFEETAR